ncbi:hypothetical protein C1646_758247 [Rhizophagus diaphanus]|nr:hypothetical protein C1646_758247 [Rhizophagus diaphanus] [Rhizophagus sp. MUCL 43196]
MKEAHLPLPPVVIFKLKNVSQEIFPNGVFIKTNQKGWVNDLITNEVHELTPAKQDDEIFDYDNLIIGEDKENDENEE